jgi:hypothetical protein
MVMQGSRYVCAKEFAMVQRIVGAGLAMMVVWATLVVPGAVAAADGGVRTAKGQTVYVPVYSNVYSGPRKNPLQLATMLSIRNVDLTMALKVTAIDYYDNDGRLVTRYLTTPLMLRPLATHHIYLEEKDTRGGFGANFIVRWSADKAINTPIIECVMIGATGGQGISFVSPGQEIRE